MRGDIARTIVALSSLSPGEREVLCDAMFGVLEHPRHSLNGYARVGAVNTILAMPSHALRRLRRILSKRTPSAAEVHFTVFVFMPSAIAELPKSEARELERIRDDYLRRPVSSEAASQAAYGMTLFSLEWKTMRKLLGIYSHSPSQVSRMAARDALESAYFHLGRRLKLRLFRELKRRLAKQRNRRLRFFTTLALERFQRKARRPEAGR